jgi:hypothetical protein
MQDTPNPKKTSARDSLQRVAEHLYRHSVHGTYYGIMTIGGKLKKKALCAFEGRDPTTDRATATSFL